VKDDLSVVRAAVNKQKKTVGSVYNVYVLSMSHTGVKNAVCKVPL